MKRSRCQSRPSQALQETRHRAKRNVRFRIMEEHRQVERHDQAQDERDNKDLATGRGRLGRSETIRLAPGAAEDSIPRQRCR